MMQKEELARLLQLEYNEFADVLRTRSETELLTALPGKWTPAQVAAHLHLSLRPVAMAFGLPTFALKMFFGTANRPSRSYPELVARYQQKLAAGDRAGRAFTPALKVKVDRTLQRLRANSRRLGSRLMRFTEHDLDRLLLPHPLLGKLTLREMIYFTAYHARHHRLQLG